MNEEATPTILIIPIAEEHIAGFRECLDVVARERAHLFLLQAPPLEEVVAFVQRNIQNGYPQYVAISNEQVIGWCDITPIAQEGFQHVGALGMGVHPEYRGLGIGTRLLLKTLDRARKFGLERIELEVLTSNKPAIALYERFGFEVEGVKKRLRKLGGDYDDSLNMALFLD